MLAAKQVADLITALRASLFLILPWLGLAQGQGGLPLAVWLMIANWTADSVDGSIARRSRIYYRTWIGDHDLEIDMAVSIGLLGYMVVADLLGWPLAALYVLLWALVFWRTGAHRSLGMLSQAPVYAWFILVSIREAPASGWWTVFWILAAVVITWPKFPKEIVPGFLSGMRKVHHPDQRPSH